MPFDQKQYLREYYQKNKEKIKARSKAWYYNNKERALKTRRDYKWCPKKAAARQSKFRADRLNRTPPWADLEAIYFFYECCPAGCHVDHVIPLRGEIISGLHVEDNLQWLPAQENRLKKNKWSDSM